MLHVLPMIFIKLGGSLITDKTQRYAARHDVITRLAGEIAAARRADPTLQILVGHGSGSFGHVAARESGYDPRHGHSSPLALAKVGAAASRLNAIVRDALLEAEIATLSFAPSASARLADGQVVSMAIDGIRDAMAQGIVPLVFGDVALFADGTGAGIASTEAVFRYLAAHLHPTHVYLLGVVDGVFTAPPQPNQPPPPLISQITPATWPTIAAGLGGSHGTDVTGGMVSKVAETLALVQANPGLHASIVNGETPNLLTQLLLDPSQQIGTQLTADK